MKKLRSIILSVCCVLLLCAGMTACDSISKEEYDKLNNEYNELLEEKRELEKLSDWIELYHSVELGQSFSEISVMIGFEYSGNGGGGGVSSDGSKYQMDIYSWTNKELFDINSAKENQILVVFLDGIAIYKQYGNQSLILDNGTVRFPASTDIIQDS